MSAESVPVPPVPASFRRPAEMLSDFDDRISPMVVKELRQGLRNRVFIMAFLILHIVLVVNLLLAIGDRYSRTSGGAFWGFIAMALVWLLPARNLSAISDEMKHRTLETLVLTRLTAWRIVAGKWASTAAQIILLGISVIPYLIMRYIALGTELPAELMLLAMTVLAGLTFTAMVTGMSGTGSWVARTMLFILVGVTLLSAVPRLSATGDLAQAGSAAGLLLALLPCLWIGVLCLDGAAAMIAPAAENHSTLRRVVTLAMLSAAVLAMRTGIPVLGDLAIPALVVGMVLGLADAPNHLPVVHAPFVRRGAAGRMAALLLAPGPSSGLVYSLLLALLWLWGVGALGSGPLPVPVGGRGPAAPSTAGEAWFFVASLLLPALLLSPAPPAWRWRGVIYVLVLIILFGIGVVAMTVAGSGQIEALKMLALATPVSLDSQTALLSPGMTLTGIWAALLLITVRKDFSDARTMRRLVAENLHLV